MHISMLPTPQAMPPATRNDIGYVPAGGAHGFKRQRLCPALQAKSRRRSTQGIVSYEAVEEARFPNGTPKPDWVRELEEDAEADEDIADIMHGAGGNPDVIKQRIKASMEGKRKQIVNGNAGEQEQMGVEFREVDPFNLWLWFELYRSPSPREAELLEEVLASWFMLGRLGAYNTQNLQVYYKANEDISYMDYESEECDTGLHAFFHDITQVELQDNWARCWVNLGTADELALDMLINALSNFSKENMGIKKLYVGGDNEEWEIPQTPLPKAKMDPMQGPIDTLDY